MGASAMDRILLRPTETHAGDPEHYRMMDNSPNGPGVSNALDISDARDVYGGGPNCGA